MTGMWGFTHLTISSTYTTDLLPWIVVLAFGMGLTFVPLTLTAVAGVDDEDSGAASAALNTAQQIGGAIGLAALTTVFSHAFRGKAADLTAALHAQASSMTPEQIQHSTGLIPLVAQTAASTRGFLVGTGMLAVAAIVTLVALNVKHEELAAREEHQGAHIG
jgi:hypothetical protein